VLFNKLINMNSTRKDWSVCSTGCHPTRSGSTENKIRQDYETYVEKNCSGRQKYRRHVNISRWNCYSTFIWIKAMCLRHVSCFYHRKMKVSWENFWHRSFYELETYRFPNNFIKIIDCTLKPIYVCICTITHFFKILSYI